MLLLLPGVLRADVGVIVGGAGLEGRVRDFGAVAKPKAQVAIAWKEISGKYCHWGQISMLRELIKAGNVGRARGNNNNVVEKRGKGEKSFSVCVI